jgi:hypothetical protein
MTIDELQEQGWIVIGDCHVDGEISLLLQKRNGDRVEFGEYSLKENSFREIGGFHKQSAFFEPLNYGKIP